MVSYLDLARKALAEIGADDGPLLATDCGVILGEQIALIAADYEPGTVDAVFTTMPDLAKKILEAEDDLEAIAARGTTEAEFRQVLAGYVVLWREASARVRARREDGGRSPSIPASHARDNRLEVRR